MIALALEFSSDRRSVAVARDTAVLAEVAHQGTQRTPIFALIGAALQEAGITREQVEAIAVGIGPGSYTGVRLAISVAQGWQLATGVRVAAVNSLANLARVTAEQGVGRVLLAVDAQRQEAAVAEAEGGVLLSPVRLLPLADLQERQRQGEIVAGPEVVRLLGGGCELFPSARIAAQLAVQADLWLPAEQLAPVYLREASFVKAPPPRLVA